MAEFWGNLGVISYTERANEYTLLDATVISCHRTLFLPLLVHILFGNYLFTEVN